MKRIFTILTTLAFPVAALAQNISVTDPSGMNVTEQTVVFNTFSTDVEDLAENFYVHNNGSSSINVKCRRTEISVVPTTATLLCWTVCSAEYTAGTAVTLTAPGPAQTIAPGDSVNLLVLHFKPYGTTGSNLYKVTFFNTADAADTANLFIRFDVAMGLNENLNKPVALSAYPNPANNNVTIDIENGFTEKATLRIVDALGVTVKTVNVNSNSMKISTSDLREGVYFYSLVSNNKAVMTRRLVISR